MIRGSSDDPLRRVSSGVPRDKSDGSTWLSWRSNSVLISLDRITVSPKVVTLKTMESGTSSTRRLFSSWSFDMPRVCDAGDSTRSLRMISETVAVSIHCSESLPTSHVLVVLNCVERASSTARVSTVAEVKRIVVAFFVCIGSAAVSLRATANPAARNPPMMVEVRSTLQFQRIMV